MSLLLNQKQLKEAAEALPYSALVQAVDTLSGVIKHRAREAEVIAQLKKVARDRGYSLESLGFMADRMLSGMKTVDVARPVKPKFKTINIEKQVFYFESGELKLLPTHTMKKALLDAGISLVTHNDLAPDDLSKAKQLVSEALERARQSYNDKVDIWNRWAGENGGVALSKR